MLVRNLVDLHNVERDDDLGRISKVEDRIHDYLGDAVPKAVAARVLGVGAGTLNSYIEQGRVATTEDKTGRELVATRPLVEFVVQVQG